MYKFIHLISALIRQFVLPNPYINIIREEIKELDTSIPTIISSGPLTSPALTEKIREFIGEDYLYFFDAIAPIIEKDSI